MKLHPEHAPEYIKRHNPIWRSLEQLLKAQGVSNYSIFLDESTHHLFAYAEIESEARWAAIAESEVCQQWWAHMAPLMETNSDNSPVSESLTEVFHLP